MPTPKYYLGPMGDLYHSSGEPVDCRPLPKGKFDRRRYVLRKLENEMLREQGILSRPMDSDIKGKGKEVDYVSQTGTSTQDSGSNAAEYQSDFVSAAVEANLARREKTYPDGPWLRSPDEIRRHPGAVGGLTGGMRDDITVEENRELFKRMMRHLADSETGPCIMRTIGVPRAVDMATAERRQDPDLVDLRIERRFVNAPMYLVPGAARPPSMLDRLGEDWRWNARGVYYRHYFSPEWVTADHELWVPTVQGVDWRDPTEDGRRDRAKRLLKHALDNAGWNKSEYGWGADAWTDVFGQMRDDPVIAADKHEYCTVRSAVHPVSCLETGKSKFMRRIPDATFGLATFQAKDYQNCLASHELDSERLLALARHHHTSLLADPRWGEANLVYPFAVYEAKGWSGDPRQARYQACAAASQYLDLLDALARQPGGPRNMDRDYQTTESRNAQVFAITSFGAHWHVMVGYRRPRLAREYAGREGMSNTVYLFQRIWSGRISTERKAWELLSIIDQIHEWGVTKHRDFVIQHLKPWHRLWRQTVVDDLRMARDVFKWDDDLEIPPNSYLSEWMLPDWTKHFSGEALSKLKLTAGRLITEALRKYRAEIMSAEPVEVGFCLFNDCNSDAEYTSLKGMADHLREWHGLDVDDCADLQRSLEDACQTLVLRSSDSGEPKASDTDKEVDVQVTLKRKRKYTLESELDDGDPGPSSRKRVRP